MVTIAGLDNLPHLFFLRQLISCTKITPQLRTSGTGNQSVVVIAVCHFAYSVPSGAPQSLEAMFVQSTEVLLRWREVPCVQQNGPITGYVVRYYPTCGADRGVQQNRSVVATCDIIDGLTPNTEYAFEVAAVNVNRTGPFSEPITLGGKLYSCI